MEGGTIPPIHDDNNHGFDSKGKLKLNCRFCGVKQECWKQAGYTLTEKEGRPYMGKPTSPNYFVEAVPGKGEPTLADTLKRSLEEDERVHADMQDEYHDSLLGSKARNRRGI